MTWFEDFVNSTINCLCCSGKRTSNFVFDREKFRLRVKKNSQQLDNIINSGIMQMFETADFKDTAQLDHQEVERLVSQITKEGFVFPLDVWAFDFNRSGFIELNEFEACMRAALHARKENMQLFFRSSHEAAEQGRAAWLSSGLDLEWTMTKAEVEIVLAEFEETLGEPFMQDADQCMAVYAKRHKEELSLRDFQAFYNDFLCSLYLLPKSTVEDDGENNEAVKGNQSVRSRSGSPRNVPSVRRQASRPTSPKLAG